MAVFALLALVCELTGRSLTMRLDGKFHVTPLAASMAPYYPFLLAGVRLLAALALAGVAWKLVRAHVTASAGEALLRTLGQHHIRAPQLRLTLTPQRYLAAFAATALWYLVQTDAERLSEGRWPLLAPWLHSYALPVFAVLAVFLALGWSAVSDWLAEVERYAATAIAHVQRALRLTTELRRARPSDDHAPRHQFGVVFASRGPPVPA